MTQDKDISFAVVTGASSGIGKELAREAASRGADLLVIADGEDIHAVAAELRATGREVIAVQADLATKEGVVDEIKDSNLEYAMRVHGLSKRESAEYKLVEFNSRRPKFPWSVVSKVDGKRYKLTNITAKVHFA